MKYLNCLLFLSVISIISCTTITEPTLQKVKNVEIIEVSTKKLEIDAVMVIHNPNSFALDLAEADMKAIVDDIELAHFTQNYDAAMPARSDFDMPIRINLNLTELYKDNPLSAITRGLKILNEKKLSVQFLGDIKVGRGPTKLTVLVDKIELVEF